MKVIVERLVPGQLNPGAGGASNIYRVTVDSPPSVNNHAQASNSTTITWYSAWSSVQTYLNGLAEPHKD